MKQLFVFFVIVFSCLIFLSCTSIKNFSPKKNIDSLKIEYDFANPYLGSTRYAEPGRNIELILKNINPNIYTISVDDTIKIYDAQKPTGFDAMFTTELKTVNITADTANTTPPNPEGVASSAGGTPSARKAAKEREKVYNENKTKIELLNDELALFLTFDYASLKQTFLETEDLGNIPAELDSAAAMCNISQTDKIVKANAFILDKMSGITEAQIPVGLRSNIERTIIETDRLALDNETIARQLIKKYTAIKESADISQYRALEKSIEEKISVLNNVIENISKMKEKLGTFKKMRLGSLVAEAYEKVLGANISKVVHKTIPRNSADEYWIKVNIQKKNPVKNCAIEPTSFSIPIYVEKGIKIDFSTGVVFNFGRDKFFDQKYRYDSVYRTNGTLADSVKIAKIKSNYISQISLGAFAHVYSRIRRELNLGGVLGISLSADQRVYYHAGLSALIGKNDRFVISSGASFAKSKYLDTQYDVNQIMKRSLSPTVIPVEEVTRIGFFVSLSYNLNLVK
jgi:hypothetical protein